MDESHFSLRKKSRKNTPVEAKLAIKFSYLATGSFFRGGYLDILYAGKDVEFEPLKKHRVFHLKKSHFCTYLLFARGEAKVFSRIFKHDLKCHTLPI